ncbi:hypothetical protein Goshw_008968 [Gossypium schwendimanii]|uniref:Uncharacterized protein n=1 Tax=Gossypium schwendimanii TaxID=34291 RepID=A0A7J9MM48_GOSSC|nr:hypothetical protein [Gossypium schwendimanii]
MRIIIKKRKRNISIIEILSSPLGTDTSFQLKQLEFLNNFLNAVADLHQKLESDLFELGVIEIDDILLKLLQAQRDHFLISDECQQLYSESRSETPDASVESSWQTMDGFEKCLRPQNFEGDPGIPIDLIIMESIPNQDNTSEFGDIGMGVDFEDFEAWSSWLNSSTVTHGHGYQNNFLNAVADIHQKLKSDLFELRVTEIDDMLLKRDFFLVSNECQQLHSKSCSKTLDASVESSWKTVNGFGKRYLGPQNFDGEPGIRDQFLNNFLNAVADLHQKLESDLSKLGVTKIDDIVLNVRDIEFTGLELSWMKKKLTNNREKILEHETKIKMLEETIRQTNLELARLRKRPQLE